MNISMILKYLLKILIIIIIIIPFSCNSQVSRKKTTTSIADSLVASLELIDSIKILKIDTIGHNIAFIDFNKESKFHDKLLKFRGNDLDSNLYYSEYLNQKENLNGLNITKVPQEFSKKWIQLFKYNNEYFVFMDCEFQMVYQTTDSTFISYFMDGGYPSIIKDVIHINSEIKLITKRDTVEIKPIENYIYQIKVDGRCNYYTSSEWINKFNIIVQRCRNKSEPIINFENIDCK